MNKKTYEEIVSLIEAIGMIKENPTQEEINTWFAKHQITFESNGWDEDEFWEEHNFRKAIRKEIEEMTDDEY